jgi:hypothetical protein
MHKRDRIVSGIYRQNDLSHRIECHREDATHCYRIAKVLYGVTTQMMPATRLVHHTWGRQVTAEVGITPGKSLTSTMES